MGDRPISAVDDSGAGRGDPDSPSDETIRLDPRPERESHSVHEAVPGGPAGPPPVQRDANTRDVSASTPQGPHPSTGTVNQLPWYCLDDCSRRVCSRWLREIDICELQGCWSAPPALCADAVRQVDFAHLWSRREVEARPSSAWAEPTSSVCRPWVPRTACRRSLRPSRQLARVRARLEWCSRWRV
mgnify:CR=1 FL=1